MQNIDTMANLIAFLFAKDREDHPPPENLLPQILCRISDEKTQSTE